jgi:multicomponent Na+:H+ antiporter subunit D
VRRLWGDRGVFARAWPIGTTSLWVVVLLIAYVLDYYL